ncbi:MAG TPA: hypothetical protein VMV69_02255 [Pirellulales bacterium]|nr:hypothetical protein [Pirellulales bacterium]
MSMRSSLAKNDFHRRRARWTAVMAILALAGVRARADNAPSRPSSPTVVAAPRRALGREPTASGSEKVSPPDHQFWLVSTRGLPHDGVPKPHDLRPRVWRRRPQAGWTDSTLDELFSAGDSRLVTTVLVHGNDTDHEQAIAKGTEVFREFRRGDAPARPFRLIVWSWPSEHIPGPFRRDARIKAQRAEIEAYYLAAFVERLGDEAPASLVGYSLGARTVTGALHLMGGGRLDGHGLPPGRRESAPRLRAVLLAAAVDGDWLLPGGRHGRALSAVEQMAVLVNPDDRVLRFYRFLSPGGGAPLGAAGMGAAARRGEDREKIVEVNVADAVGKKHAWTTYIAAPKVVEHVKSFALFDAGKKPDAPMNARKLSDGPAAAAGGG